MPDFSASPYRAQQALSVLVDAVDGDRKSSQPLHAVTQIFSSAEADAVAIDSGPQLPLAGWVVLMKACLPAGPNRQADAGVRLLRDVSHPIASPLQADLRTQGALVAGQAAMSEWSGMRGSRCPSGWSAVAGQVGNPRAPGHTPWGSSSGSAAAVAAGWVRAAVGTDTSGSITLPAAVTGTVGMRPSLPGRALNGAIGISRAQDRPGFIARNTADLGRLWHALTGAGAGQWSGKNAIAVVNTGGDPVTQAALADWQSAASARGWRVEEVSSDSLRALADAPDEVTLLTAEFSQALDDLVAAVGWQVACGNRTELFERFTEDPTELWDVVGGDLLQAACTMDQATAASLMSARPALEQRAWAILAEALASAQAPALALLVPLSAWPVDDQTFPTSDPATTYPTVAPCIAGWPQVCIPIGLDGPPVGLVLTMPPGDDGALIALAHELAFEGDHGHVA